jgi:hypothetical protein
VHRPALRIRTLVVIASFGALVAIPGHAAGQPSSPITGQASGCRNLSLSQSVRAALLRAFKRHRGVHHVRGPVGGAYYGTCGSVRWAYASFSATSGATRQEKIDLQDQPDVFRHRVGHRWKDKGDTGGGCPRSIPVRLRRIWNLSACVGVSE